MRVLITGATGLVGGHRARMQSTRAAGERYRRADAVARLTDIVGVYNPRSAAYRRVSSRYLTDPVDIVFLLHEENDRREAGGKAAFIHADYTLVVDTALTGRRLGARHMVVVAQWANAHSPFSTIGERRNGGRR